MTTMHPGAQGERLLSGVERLIDDCDTLIAQVAAYQEAAGLRRGPPAAGSTRVQVVAHRIISSYSNRSAMAGGVTALPSIVPGPGWAVALLGGSLVDVALTLKHEVEMILCLSYLYGHDIRDEAERWTAFVMAGVRVYEVQSGRNYFADLAEAQLDALPRYAPRELFKLAAMAFGRLALLSASRGVVKAVPVVGIVVSASVNKFVTDAVGWRCVDALERRAQLGEWPQPPPVDAVVA